MPALSQEDLIFWEQNGYVVVRGAVPPGNCRVAAEAVWEFLGMNSADPDTWYPDPPRRNIMVEMFHHQALWDNRQAPKIHEAFSQIWETDRLWVSLDRASLNPPQREQYAYTGPFLHWDFDLTRPVQLLVQGVLYLTDTAADQGAFACIPGFHHHLLPWLANLPQDVDPREEVRKRHAQEAVYVAGKAGDLVIWHSRLPHGSSPNTSDSPRVAQYISMMPARDDDEDLREQRITGWRERLTGLGQNRTDKEHQHGKTAELSSLGRKLLGLDRWEVDDQQQADIREMSDLERQMLGVSGTDN